MRIIDKNKDYYDYLQCYDDDVVFDRRGSYVLTDKEFMDYVWLCYNDNKLSNKYILLSVGYSYWLFNMVCTDRALINEYIRPINYSLELLEHWKDYEHFTKLHFGQVEKNYSTEYLFSKKWDWKSNLIDEIKRGNYKYKCDFTERHPNLIFRNIKIPSVVMADDLYNAFDEYFSHLKDDVKVDNMTDIEKVESHGFDKKTSFRGK